MNLQIDFNKNLIGWVSVILVFISAIPYYYMIFRNRVKPHVFSWLIWRLVTGIGFVASYSENSGPGCWSTGVACLTCLSVTIISLFKGEKIIKRGDWLTLMCALIAVPLWLVTKNPLWSVIVITFMDMMGFYPTMRKSYDKPYEESAFTYAIGGLNYGVALLAIQHWTIATWLYPASMVLTCSAEVTLLVTRRMTFQEKFGCYVKGTWKRPLSETIPALNKVQPPSNDCVRHAQ